jgi:hypothetical protein
LYEANRLAIAHQLGQGKKVRLEWPDYLDLRQEIQAHPAYSGIGWKQLSSGHGVPD